MNGVLSFLKPFAWLVAIAFVSGFLGYLVVGRPSRAAAHEGLQTAAASSGPASDEWNLPKHI
ncbi:MAG: hypothetical protein KGO51_01740 [Alphaproteobacteria bacterium]|nr:hypothetical protein [Alphaproteobacteria bacterium]